MKWLVPVTLTLENEAERVCIRKRMHNLLWHLICLCLDVWIQVESEFILESERDSFIEQVREVIENADEKGLERDVEKQVRTALLSLLLQGVLI